jgi:hypothetical protein
LRAASPLMATHGGGKRNLVCNTSHLSLSNRYEGKKFE